METIKKSMILDSMENLPEQVDVDDVIERIILISKVERARRQAEEGMVYSMYEVKEMREQWKRK